jgi:hypothetical protein
VFGGTAWLSTFFSKISIVLRAFSIVEKRIEFVDAVRPWVLDRQKMGGSHAEKPG